jgi:hypothetical protein
LTGQIDAWISDIDCGKLEGVFLDPRSTYDFADDGILLLDKA